MTSLKDQHLHVLHQVISEEAFMGFITFNKDTRALTYYNKLARELFEIPDDLDHSKLHLDDIFAQNSRGDFRAFNQELLAHEGLYQDVMIRKVSGQHFVANIGVKSVLIEDEPLILLMVQDVTLHKKLQRELVAKQVEIKAAFEELLKQNQQLKELDVAKNRFIALTTHELRTPLAAMVASAEVLHLGLYDTQEQMKEFIDMIYEQGNHLHDLVNDILDFAKIQAGKMDFFIEDQDPIPLVQQIVDGFENMASASNVSLKLVAPDKPSTCYFDDMRLKQVISNITNNAIKYNREGGSVTIHFEVTDEVFKVFITDTGKGIPLEQINNVFNEFETLGQVSAHHKGTGLGMPISRRLMEGMGGKLLVTSEVGKGSTFWVEIPRQKVLNEEVYRPRPGIGGDLAA